MVSKHGKALDFLSQRASFPIWAPQFTMKKEKLAVVYLKGEFGGFAIHLKLI